ncbi:MAG TPA: putative peptidoglycan glycosyltransferase FtsW [Microbacteriaceae bacterium]|nr:putative peptidoglycan glycosyltransferase FtsW [Microbacteriaceae bacterium]
MSARMPAPAVVSRAVGRAPRITRLTLGGERRPMLPRYAFLLGVTLFMTVFGLIMVLSSSSVTSHDGGGSLLGQFLKQGSFALVGVPLMLIVSRIPTRTIRRAAWPLMLGAFALQLLVVATPLGHGAFGNRNWLQLGSLPAIQPSEAIKLAMVIWLGMFFVKRRGRMGEWKYFLLPVVLVTGFGMFLVLLGDDLGTVMIMALTLIGALFFGGVRLRHIGAVLAAGALVVLLFVVTSANRLSRIGSFLDPGTAGAASRWQTENGNFALASGGIFGVGLGNSHSKWAWLPSADTDFIFAIIGEELGMIGAILVIILFALLIVAFLRIYHATPDPAGRVTTAAVMVWLIGQGFVNIAVVLGALPTLGVPLPLFSSGGTAMISSLLAIGIVLSYAREIPKGAADRPPARAGASHAGRLAR